MFANDFDVGRYGVDDALWTNDDGSPERLFICLATKTTTSRDRDRYLRSTDEHEALSSHDLDSLYHMLAVAKRDERAPDRDGEKVTVTFSQILEVMEVTAFDPARLEAQPVWQEHVAKLEAKRLEEQAKADAILARQQAAANERELAEYERLRVKFGS